MEVLVAFLMATVANTVLGVDGGVLADVQIRKLGLAERAHFWARRSRSSWRPVSGSA